MSERDILRSLCMVWKEWNLLHHFDAVISILFHFSPALSLSRLLFSFFVSSIEIIEIWWKVPISFARLWKWGETIDLVANEAILEFRNFRITSLFFSDGKAFGIPLYLFYCDAKRINLSFCVCVRSYLCLPVCWLLVPTHVHTDLHWNMPNGWSFEDKSIKVYEVMPFRWKPYHNQFTQHALVAAADVRSFVCSFVPIKCGILCMHMLFIRKSHGYFCLLHFSFALSLCMFEFRLRLQFILFKQRIRHKMMIN